MLAVFLGRGGWLLCLFEGLKEREGEDWMFSR